MAEPTRAGHWPWIGGHLVIDLLNTVSWRLSPARRTEGWRSYADVLDWSAASGLLSGSEVGTLGQLAGGSAVSARAVALREAIHDAAVNADPQAAGRLTEELRAADRAGTLTHDGTDWHWADPLDLELPVRRLARSATALFLSGELSLLRRCADDECGWLFLDRSARRNRRWCIAGDCGNRNRVRAHYARQRAEAG